MNTTIMINGVGLVIGKQPRFMYPCVTYLNPFRIIEEHKRA